MKSWVQKWTFYRNDRDFLSNTSKKSIQKHKPLKYVKNGL